MLFLLKISILYFWYSREGEGCTCVMTSGDLRTTCGSPEIELRFSGLAMSTFTLAGYLSGTREPLWYFLASEGHSRGSRERNTSWNLGTKSGLCSVMTVHMAMGKTFTFKTPVSHFKMKTEMNEHRGFLQRQEQNCKLRRWILKCFGH